MSRDHEQHVRLRVSPLGQALRPGAQETLTSMFSVGIHEDTAHMLVIASGRADLAHLCGVAGMKRHRRAIFDLLAVEPTLTFSEHLQFGVHFAKALSKLARVASVVAEKERKGTSEKAAQKHGLALRTFTDLNEARRWLLDLPPLSRTAQS